MWEQDIKHLLLNKSDIVGSDECGYGSLAGIVVVCGVRAPKDWSLEGLNDSKKLSEKKRLIMGAKLADLIFKNEISFHIAERSNKEIDKAGVAVALKSAYVEVFHKLYTSQSLIIIDGNLKFDNLGVDTYDKVSLVKADTMIPAVMAASIIGKNYRDGIMHCLHDQYPVYDFLNNVGYGSANHLKAINDYGPCDLHRLSYAPMKNFPIKD